MKDIFKKKQKYIENSYEKYGYDYNERRFVTVQRLTEKLRDFLLSSLVIILLLIGFWFFSTFIFYGLNGVYRALFG